VTSRHMVMYPAWNINLILVSINCILTLTASQPRDCFHNATRVASAPIVIPPFDSPDLFLRPLLCTTVIRNVATDVTDFCHRMAVICQTVRDLSMRSSAYNPVCTSLVSPWVYLLPSLPSCFHF
jgi:hypothetical protein